MTDYDLGIARDIGGLQADVRTLKHDTAQISAKIDGLAMQVGKINSQQSKGLGFFAGASLIITLFGGLLLGAAKLIFGGLLAGSGGHS